MTRSAHRSQERARDLARLLGLDRLSLFVPALMSVGLVFWIVSEVNEVLRSRAEDAREERARIAASAIVDEALRRSSRPAPGLRPRPVYLMIAVASLGAAAYVLIGSIGNYIRSGGYVEGLAWLLATAGVAALLGVVFGITALTVFLTWPSPPPWARGILLRSPLGAPSRDDPSMSRPSWRVSAFAVWATALLAALTAIVSWSPETMEGINQRAFEWLLEQDALNSVAFLTPTGKTWIAVAVAVATVLGARRCRVLVTGYVASILLGTIVCVSLRPLVAQSRPARESVFGVAEAYPSLSMMFIVIFAGLVPLALAVLFERLWIIRPLRIGLGLLAVASGLHQITDGALATDVIGGALLGLVAIGATQWSIATERSHEECRGCPWSPAPYHGPFLGAIPIHPTAQELLRVAARLSAAAATIGLAVLTFRVDLPVDASGYGLGRSVQQTVQVVLTLLMSAGALLAWKWEGVAAVLIALAAAGAGIFAALEYEPGVALILTMVLMIPAVLLWLSWQHTRKPRQIVALAVVTAVLVSASWAGANGVHDFYFGPTHETSVAPVIPVDRVEWVWSGALSATAITVSAQLVPDVDSAQLEVEPRAGGRTVLTEAVVPDEYGLVKFTVDDLEPETDHRYRLVVDETPDEGRGSGQFSTPAEGPFSFTVTASSCARTSSNVAVYDSIRAVDPLFHLALGDMHYENIESTSPSAFIDAYERALTTPAQGALARDVPVAYMWDDHDYGPNDADASFIGRSAVREAYRAAVPHYPAPVGDAPINQAFTIGRVRFVLTDQRSERTADTMLGEIQRTWLLDELRRASATHAVVVWVNTVPWIGPAADGADGWAGQAREREEIADAIAAADIDNLMMVSGDAHMLAIDDGTNSNYSAGGGAGFPVFHAAALDRPGNVKGGPYSEGAFPGFGQFGVLEVDDGGGTTVTVRMSGRNWKDERIVGYERAFTAAPPR